MRIVIGFFIALLAIPITQVAVDRWSDRAGPHLLGEPQSGLTMAAGKHRRAPDLEFFTVPKIERRPKAG
jgi:hypothetical protein